MESGNNKVGNKVASGDELDNEVVSSNKVGDKVGDIGNKVGDIGDEVDNVGDEVDNKVGDVGDEVDDVGDEVDDVGDKVGDVGDKDNEVGSSNKDKEDSKKVDGEDKPEEISIDKETTNLLNIKPKPPKARFWIKDAIKAKFGPNTEYTASIIVEAENSSIKKIIIAKNIT
ncbi:uncharacterized protein K441DRAFT_673175 [Cenococcum geophilum 1.58]|uniref:uncharacterized protein n=1 Tax=Cenococcum geophilum 1.58 TaxID=794803 RepID=UPI00358E4E3C|nr:hypothetical protein K441DRAFT_673175 [Cenococcum geophilum 1.58]